MPLFLSAIRDPQSAVGSGWQLIFVSFAVVVILLETLRGWRLGLMRQLVRVLAILAAYCCAIFAGRALVPVMRAFFKMPDAILTTIGGAVLAFLAYAIITGIGTILFKRTGQYESGVMRVLWGSSGAVFGIFFGAFFVWLVFAGVRLVGSVAQAQVPQSLTAATMQPVWNQPLQIHGKSSAPAKEKTALASTLAQMKNSLEAGPIGDVIKNADPIPPTLYRTFEKMGSVASNVERAERFLSFPGAREIGEHPKIVALRNDPEIADLIAHGHILELLQNQRIIDAANDPALRDRIKKFNLDRALDYALKKN